MDLNHRPHAYQACALNHLSYRPIYERFKSLSKLNMMNVWKCLDAVFCICLSP
jgi:hypothetical protein